MMCFSNVMKLTKSAVFSLVKCTYNLILFNICFTTVYGSDNYHETWREVDCSLLKKIHLLIEKLMDTWSNINY